MRFEQRSAFARVGVRLDAAELGVLRREHERAHVHLAEEPLNVLACLADQHVGKEIAVAVDDTEGWGPGVLRWLEWLRHARFLPRKTAVISRARESGSCGPALSKTPVDLCNLLTGGP